MPYSDRDRFQQLSRARFDVVDGASSSLDAVAESLAYLEDLVRLRRRQPGPGLIGGLVADHGSELTDRQLAGVADGLLTGGLETTASLLGLSTLILLQNPHDRARLAEDRSFVAPYVDELLRYLSVVQVAFPRFARRDVDLDGSRVRRGDIMLCSLSVAGRDPRVGEHPERIDAEAARRPGSPSGTASIAASEPSSPASSSAWPSPHCAADSPTCGSRRPRSTWSTAHSRWSTGSGPCR